MKKTKICVPVFVHDSDQARRDVARAVAAGADVVELRIDLLTSPADVAILIEKLNTVPAAKHTIDGVALPEVADVPLLYTCRAEYEGGQSALSDAERVTLLKACHAARPGWIDIELTALTGGRGSAGEAAAFKAEKNTLVSHHDFEGRPDRLYNTLAEISEHGQATKIAWRARSVRDNLEAFDLLLQQTRPTTVLCMGEAGLTSRVLAKKFGAQFTYASLDDSSATAPGQVSIGKLKTLYRFDEQNAKTKVFGVIAKPVAQSMSPAVHNAAFAHMKMDAVYLPFLVEDSYESFKAFVESFATFEPLHLGGLSVTVPHKENALRYLSVVGATIDELSTRIGAVNTILIKREGKRISYEGRNTDYAAILDCVTAGLGVTREQLKGVRVAVLGAGGTGRTAVAALTHYGADVVIVNRTKERAESLAFEFNGKPGKVTVGSHDDLKKTPCRVYINTTTRGMTPNVETSPFGDTPPPLGPGTLVFDTVYNPPETRLLREAKAAGATVIGGAEMFVRQAAAQFEAWTGKPAPIEVMRAALAAGLA